MAGWDNTIQRRVPMPPLRMETGRVAAAGVSGQTFTVATKFSKVIAGFGLMEADALTAFATTGSTGKTGTITFTRYGPILTSADYIQYTAFGW